MSLRETARLAGVTHVAIWKLERRQSLASTHYWIVANLATAFGIRLIFDGDYWELLDNSHI